MSINKEIPTSTGKALSDTLAPRPAGNPVLKAETLAYKLTDKDKKVLGFPVNQKSKSEK